MTALAQFVRSLWFMAAGIALAAAAYVGWVLATLPDVGLLVQANPAVTGYMQAREGAGAGPQVRHTWVPLDDISPVLACTVARAEDTFFSRHSGIAWHQLIWVAGQLLRGRTRLGTSTITQQLARNLYLTPERSFHRKFEEILIAESLERKLTKARILELYLNVVEWGDGIWGIGDASRHYCGRPPADLRLFESTFLASLLPAPRAALAGGNRVRAFLVQTNVLWDMQATGLIEAADSASVFNRISLLHLGLQSGEPISAALRRQIDNPIDDGSSMDSRNRTDYLLVTNTADFALLKKSPFNVVLQDNPPGPDDGSLSRLAARMNLRYVNAECTNGAIDRQKQMLDWLDRNLP